MEEENKVQNLDLLDENSQKSKYNELLEYIDEILADNYTATTKKDDILHNKTVSRQAVDEILEEVQENRLLPLEELQLYDTEYSKTTPDGLLENEKKTEDNDNTLSYDNFKKGSEEQLEKTKKPKLKSIVGEIAFYAVLIGIVLGIASLKGEVNSKGPKSIAGFSAFTVLTSSMESVIPKGSLVITKYTEPQKLEIGDDITYLANQSTTITHRIIGIIENYEDTGQRAFETKGVTNDSPDKRPVTAANVVGKVIFHSYAAGKAASFVGEHWMVLLLMIILLFGLVKTLKSAFSSKEIKKE